MKTYQRLLSFLAFCAFTAPVSVLAEQVTTIATGLNSARGLAVGSDGAVYVTESGIGGTSQNCVFLLNLNFCSGTTGSITKIKDGTQQRVLTSLPSVAAQPELTNASGPQDIQFDSAGNPYVLFANGGEPSNRNTWQSPGLGQLYKLNFETGTLTSVADISTYLEGKTPESNPFAFSIAGSTAYVADAGGNAIVSVNLDGSNLKTVAILPTQNIKDPVYPQDFFTPPPPDPKLVIKTDKVKVDVDFVPSGVETGPDGLLYVSEFTGYPFPEGKSRIFQIDKAGKLKVYLDGFTQIIDIKFDSQGNLYVLQYANQSVWKGNLTSSLIKVDKNKKRTTLANGTLQSATALAIGPDDSIYVTNKGDRPNQGEVIKITP
jgi:hypothetical protein